MYSSLDTVWVLLCTALIFFMQAGFAMLETGFTRAKNAGNIIMKNLMDYCIGSVLFWVIGFSFLYGDSIGGFIGTPSLFAAGKFAAAGDLPKRVFNCHDYSFRSNGRQNKVQGLPYIFGCYERNSLSYNRSLDMEQCRLAQRHRLPRFCRRNCRSRCWRNYCTYRCAACGSKDRQV